MQNEKLIVPSIGEKWTHAEGGVYEIDSLINYKLASGEWELIVTYCGADGSRWARRVPDFIRRFTKSADANLFPDATKMVPDDQCRKLFEDWHSSRYEQHLPSMRTEDGYIGDALIGQRWKTWKAAWDARDGSEDLTIAYMHGAESAKDAWAAERARLRTALAHIADKDTYDVNGRGAFAQIANDALEGK